MESFTTMTSFDQSPAPIRGQLALSLEDEQAGQTDSVGLGNINWNFPTHRSDEIEGLHPYPAKFISELPRALLKSLPVSRGATVFDPFCGSGTTLVESQRLGFPTVGIDLNPIACLISRVKTAPLPHRIAQVISSVALEAQAIRNPSIPLIPNLDHWFQPNIQTALAALMTAIRNAPLAYRDILRLALSSIVVRVSNQESDTRYAAIQKNVTPQEVFSGFARSAQRITATLARRDYALTTASVFEADTLRFDPTAIGQTVGLVITSPPYPNAYEYWLYHKYRMWWLGFDPLAVKEREIGARAHFFKRDHHTAEHFVDQMASVFVLLRKVMLPGAHACFVIGRSKIHGKLVDNARAIEDIGAKAGFTRVFAAERVLSPNRKSFNLSHANIKTETVLIMKFAGDRCG